MILDQQYKNLVVDIFFLGFYLLLIKEKDLLVVMKLKEGMELLMQEKKGLLEMICYRPISF